MKNEVMIKIAFTNDEITLDGENLQKTDRGCHHRQY